MDDVNRQLAPAAVPTVITLRAKERVVRLADGKTFSVRRVVQDGRMAIQIDGLEIVGFGEDDPKQFLVEQS